MSTARTRSFAIALALGALPVTVVAGVIPLLVEGPEEQINTQATGDQLGQDLVCNSSGACVAVWAGETGAPDTWAVFGQRYADDGSPAGSEFQVGGSSADATYGGPRSRTCVDAAGEFAVVWTEPAGPGDRDVQARVYDAGGTAKAASFQVNSYTTDYQILPAVACMPGGGFVVTWMSGGVGPGGPDGDASGIFARRYDSNGTAQGGEFQVNAYTTGYQWGPDVAVDASGAFVVAWTDDAPAFPSALLFKKVRARRFDAAGVPLGADLLVAVSTSGGGVSGAHVAAADDGSFIVAWAGSGNDWDVFRRSYSSDGTPSGVFVVNSYTPYAQGRYGALDVSADAEGRFVIVWEGAHATGDGILAQAHDQSGALIGGELQINEYTTGSQAFPAVTAAGAQRFVASWSGDGADGDGFGVFLRRLRMVDEGACRLPGSSLISLRVSGGTRDKLIWKWRKGAATPPPAFGDPLSTTEYSLTLYDQSGLVVELVLPPSSLWSSSGSGYRYKDKTGSSAGLVSAGLKHGNGVPGRAKITFKGKGPGLGLSALALGSPVAVVLASSDGECWSGVYSAPQRNTADRFKAKQ